jgi:putative ABC transport system permease protein
VSDQFFDVFSTQPAMGRSFGAGMTEPDRATSVVVSYGFWQAVLGGGSFQDKQFTFSNQVFNVIGVMPASFNFPAGAEIWAPREVYGPFNPSRSAHNWSVIGRLRQGSDAQSATRELSAIAKSIRSQYRDVTAVDAIAIPLQEQLTQSVRIAFPVLFASVGILLLVACANVTNLLLAHIAGRNRELAVRTALGASRSSIARLFLTESLILTAAGGTIGAILSAFAVNALLKTSDGTLPRIDEIRPDAWVLTFAILISLLVGFVLGLLPALRLGRMNLDDTLKQGGRAQSEGTASRTARSGLVVAQVALTIVLLVGAGLLGRSFVQLLQVNLGFQTDSRLAIEMLAPQAQGPEGRQRAASQIEQLLQGVASLPGVSTVGGVSHFPLSGRGSNGRFGIEGGTDSGSYWPDYRIATPGYFETLGIPLIRGRLFNATDGASTPEVAVVSQDVANNVWPGQDPIGKRINYGNMDGDQNLATIVGIVGDIRNSPEGATRGAIYVHYLQRGFLGNFTLVLRATGPTDSLVTAIGSQVRAANPEASMRVQTLDQMFSSNLANRRFNFALLAVFGGSALILALLGVYGVTAYSVAQRRQEIGIRIALGAQPTDVTRMFLSEGSKLVLLGVVIGSAAALAASRVLSTLLVNVKTTDVWAYLLAIIPMFIAALLANHLPARRAARVDPMIAMQQDRM